MRMGLREANQRFSAAVKVVRAGGEVVLTERGKPIAVLKPLPESATGETVIRQLEAAGLLRAAAKPAPLPRWTPRRLTGISLSRTIREERDESSPQLASPLWGRSIEVLKNGMRHPQGPGLAHPSGSGGGHRSRR